MNIKFEERSCPLVGTDIPETKLEIREDLPEHTLVFYRSAKWKVWLSPGLCVELETAPNIFHRWMQRLLLGFRYQRFSTKD